MMKRENNVLSLLNMRQSGQSRCQAVSDFNILKILMTKSENRSFIDGGYTFFQGDMRYGDGKVIVKDLFNKDMVCLDIINSSDSKNFRKLWSLSSKPRWEDHHIVSAPLPSHLRPPQPHEAHKPYLLVLRADNRLQRYSLGRGGLTQEISLLGSDHHGYRFTEMLHDLQRHWLVLSSIKVKKPNSGFKSFMIFEYTTLEFLYHFEVCKSVFGNSVQDANVFGGLLLILHNNSKIELFSIDEVIKADNVTEVRGCDINVLLRARPPCLFQVQSHHHHLELNMNPWLYIRAWSDQEFSLHRLDSDCLLQFFGVVADGEKEDHLEFCPDHPTKLLRYGSAGFNVYHISGEGKKLELQFQRNHPLSKESQKDKSQSSSRRPNRRVKRTDSYYEKNSDSINHVMYDYENELNIFGLMFYSESMDDNEDVTSLLTLIKQIDLYDNNFKLQRTVPLDIVHQRSAMDMRCNISLTLDRDLILITVKTSLKSSLYIYKNRETSCDNRRFQIREKLRMEQGAISGVEYNEL